jgi:hypothetical protein
MDIIKDTEFSDANVCFTAALAELKRIGKGSVVRQASFKYALSVLITFHRFFCIYQHFLFFNLVCC